MNNTKRPFAAQSVRVAVYARYSSENQRDASIEDQLRICHARASREGWEVIGNFTDHAISGSTTMRPGYQGLLSAMRSGQIDLVLSESLDRLSRDQEHVAGFHKQASFARVRIVTLAEGEISELHVGLKGTMGALFLKDLADKTRRGLEGRVREGRSGGGLCFGYRVIRGPMGRDGELERGLRAIEPAEAMIVRRVFEEFVAGDGPIAIAKRLNAEGVPSPRGGAWIDGALRGHAKAGTGLLRNRLYIGELVWNRRRWLKDPATGQRVARHNDQDSFVVEQVPELRILEQDLWDRAQHRLEQAARPQVRVARTSTDHTDHLWQHRRAPNLLSGKVACGACGSPYITSGKDYMACKAAIKQGTCSNTVRTRRTRLEGQVLDALGNNLMCPDAVALFVREFTVEWNRLAAGRAVDETARRRELEGITRKLDNLVDAIAEGVRAPGLQGRLDELTRRQKELEAELANASGQSRIPLLHPNLSALYRQRVAHLQERLEGGSGREVLEAARALIELVEIHPPMDGGKAPRIELVGHLTSLLRAAGVEGLPEPINTKNPTSSAGGVSSLSGDAGTGFEPVTFRL